MIDIAIMIEGQNGLTWERWKRIVKVVEDLGYHGLYRSDHYTNASPPDKDSLELWTSLTWLASHSKRIAFGPLVSPISFRNPTQTARMAASVDDLSNGRLVLGLGAGWQEREHQNYGWDLLKIPERFDRFEEGLQIITRLLNNDQPSDFEGEYFRIREGILLPRPQRTGGPPILIGGNGPKRTLPLVARYADEWNALFTDIPTFLELSTKLDLLIEKENRSIPSVRRSLMTSCVYGYNQAELTRKVSFRTNGKRTPRQMFKRDLMVGTATQIVDLLGRWSEAGVYRVMLQWLDLEDIDGIEGLAHQVFPQL